jgi:hypothetical protein
VNARHGYDSYAVIAVSLMLDMNGTFVIGIHIVTISS